jgi:hypothetical protein
MEVKYKAWTNVQHKQEWSATQELRYETKPITDFMVDMSDEFEFNNYRGHKLNLKHAKLVPGMAIVECDYIAKTRTHR